MILLVIVPKTGVVPDTPIATSHTHGASLFMDTKTTKCPSSLVVLASFWNMAVIRLGYASTITSVVIPTFVGFTMRWIRSSRRGVPMENYSWSSLEWLLHDMSCYTYESAKLWTGLRTPDWTLVDLYPNLVATRSLFPGGSQASTVPMTLLGAS